MDLHKKNQANQMLVSISEYSFLQTKGTVRPWWRYVLFCVPLQYCMNSTFHFFQNNESNFQRAVRTEQLTYCHPYLSNKRMWCVVNK